MIHKETLTFSDAEKGWLAGIIDGEGCLRLVKQNYVFKSSFLRKRRFSWRPLLVITNTNPDLIQHAYGILKGGCVYSRFPKSKSGKPYRKCYELVIGINKLRQVLPQIIPFLTAKKREASVLLKAIGLITEYKEHHILHDTSLEKISFLLTRLKN